MPLSPEEIAAAVKMQTFVEAYEKRGNPARVFFWCVIPIAPQVVVAKDHGTRVLFGVAVLAQLFVLAFYWWMSRRRYHRERPLVRALEREHGAELPWVELQRAEVDVEVHLAALRRLKRELDRPQPREQAK